MTSATQKSCFACKTLKPAGAFPLPDSWGNIPKRCSDCTAAFNAAAAADVVAAAAGLRICRACAVAKPFAAFSQRKGFGRAANATVTRCKECVARLSKEHYDASKLFNAKRAEAAWTSGSPEKTKTCGECKRDLPVVGFNRARREADGYKRACRECCAARNKDRRDNVLDKSQEAVRLRDHNLKRYGISAAVFEVMSEGQGHACAVCRAPRESVSGTFGFHVDHNHETGMVRALLCRACNVALGYARDSPARLRELADYLDKRALEQTPPPGSGPEAWRAYFAGKKPA